MSHRTHLLAAVLTLAAPAAIASAQEVAATARSAAPAAAPTCSSSGTCSSADAVAAFSESHGSDGSTSPPATLEVASWSFGASNPTTPSSAMGGGRVSSPRDAASGLASGKRGSNPRAGYDLATNNKRTAMCGSAAACASPSSITLTMKGKDKGPRCVSGTHFPTVVLTAGRASAQLSDAVITACDAAAGTVSLNFSKIEWR